MLEGIIFGIIQGIAEWLPVSSEGVIVLIKTNFFGGGGLESIIKFALFLHLGTALAAAVYFKKDVIEIFKTLFHYKRATLENRNIFNFLFITTLISGILGLALLKILSGAEVALGQSSTVVNFTIGLLLLVTAYLQFKKKETTSVRVPENIKTSDSVVLGVVQGFAALPGLSRSGLTVASLLLLKFDEEQALRLSFLMSIPIVLAGNIVLNIKDFNLSPENLLGFLFSFIFGLATIHVLLKIAKKINFAYFVLIFGLLMIALSLV